jgi:hypothetical protein
MCDPTLVVAGISAGMQYQQAIAQQKYQEQQAKRQNEIAASNLSYRQKASALKLRQSTEKNLAKLKEAEEEVRRRKAKVIAGKTFTGNTYNLLLSNYYRSEAKYRNTVLGNIEKNKFQFDRTQEALQNQYNAQATYVIAPDYMYTAGASALAFTKDYYDYKARKNANNVNNDYYDYNFNPDGST